MFPTADDVAIAIIAASKEVNADPILVASGARRSYGGGFYEITRARYYAAEALVKVFSPQCSAAAASRMVGVNQRPDGGNAAVFLSNLRQMRKANSIKWWNNGVFERVVTALERHREKTTQHAHPPFTPARPFASERQAKAYRDLKQAVQNTAQLSKDSP